LKREAPIFTDYNMKNKIRYIPLFIILCIFSILPITSIKDIGGICFFLFIGIISLLIAVLILTSHVNLYSDRMEVGSIFSKSIILFKEIKVVDIKSFEGSYRGNGWKTLKIIFLTKNDYMLGSIPANNRIADVITIIKNSNKELKISHNLLEYLNGSTNYKEK
jgi:hypothetical protein